MGVNLTEKARMLASITNESVLLEGEKCSVNPATIDSEHGRW
jgi:hypothetical protein